jgi:hypothetical protein
VRIVLIAAAALPLLSQGLTPVWGIRPTLKSLAVETQRIGPLLDRVKPGSWQDAPSSYASMHASLRREVAALAAGIADLERDPERMAPTLETYFRLQTLETLLGSLGEGVRKYQDAELADQFLGAISESENSRSRLRGYLLELVSTREQEWKVMDAEAQRCRGTLLRQRPAPAPRPPQPAKPK